MRIFASRGSALVATAVALLASAVMMSPRDIDENRRDRDNSAIRFSRGGLNRLDTGDVVAHHGDEGDPLPALAADGLDVAPAPSSMPGPPGGGLAAVEAPRSFGSDDTTAKVSGSRPSARPLARPYRPALGRAPPSA
jgi:hypothetical protein